MLRFGNVMEYFTKRQIPKKCAFTKPTNTALYAPLDRLKPWFYPNATLQKRSVTLRSTTTLILEYYNKKVCNLATWKVAVLQSFGVFKMGWGSALIVLFL